MDATQGQPSDFLGAREAVLTKIVGEIQGAFSKVKREDGVTLHETEVIDKCGSDRERAKARRTDTDRTWPEVPDKDIETHYAALSFLDPKGFRYYIPAFMIWSLRNYAKSASLNSDNTIYAFDIGNTSNKQRRRMSKFELLDERQSRTVARFLKFMVDFGGEHADETMAEQVLEKYWKRFL